MYISDVVLREIDRCTEEKLRVILDYMKLKHIVNIKTVKGVKIITTMEGYKDLLIYPPSALLEGDDEHDDD